MRRPIDQAFTLALACGLIHAAAGTYWASGGEVLLSTVGAWAPALRETDRPLAEVVLGAAAAGALAAAVIPPLAAWGYLRSRAVWLGLTWPVAAMLVIWGGLNTVAAWCQLVGLWPSVDPQATVGHALMWDPVMLVWGLALLAGLRIDAAARRSERCGRMPFPAAAD